MLLGIHNLENGNSIKLAKIEEYSSGGFMVTIPYHCANNGLIFKYKTTYEKRFFEINRKESTEYTVKHKIKLSYHQDGFVQFSSQNQGEIISGKDKITGIPKGLGVHSHSLSDPITSGPSFGLGFWGLDGFEIMPENKKEKSLIISTGSAKHLTELGSHEPNGYFLEAWVLDNKHSHGIVSADNKEYAYLSMMSGNESTGVGQLIRRESLRILRFRNQSFFIGLLLSKLHFNFGTKSGYYLLSPTDGKYGLMAFYPPIKTIGIDKLPTLNRYN